MSSTPSPAAQSTVCVDIGNSGMRCVLVNEPSVSRETPWSGDLLRIDWSDVKDTSDLKGNLKQALADWLPGSASQSSWLVSSVQRSMESHLREIVSETASQYRLVSYRDLGLTVEVDEPDKVGIDRLLAVAAAAAHVPDQPLIVIQAGSAITVDWFEPPSMFCGGAIMPGVPMMLRLLSTAADLLPQVAAKELLRLPPLPGRNTAAAMNAGVRSAVVGGVQHLVSRYREQYGEETLVVISGGDGPLLRPHLTEPVQVIDHLVLRGLAMLASPNQYKISPSGRDY